MQNKTGSRDIDAAFAVMTGTLLLGVILGVMCYCFMSEDAARIISAAQSDYIGFRQSADFAQILLASFGVSTLFLTALFLLGFFAFGQLPALFVLMYRGSGLGMILSQAYSGADGSRGALTVLMIVPACVISCYALCICAKESVRMSGRLLRHMMFNKPFPGMLESVKNYAVRFAALEAVAAVSAACDCICSVLLADRI